MAYLMGVDLGTSSLKVVIIDEEGNLKSQSASSYNFDTPRSGYAEQNAVVWWKAFRTTVGNVLRQLGAPSTQIKGISFSGQMHGSVFLDKYKQPIRPAILHCDARSGAQVEKIKEILGPKLISDLVLNPIYPGFLLPSLMWVKERDPKSYEKIAHVLLPKDYLKMLLTNEVTTDYSDASGTLLFDLKRARWSEEKLKKLNISDGILPRCYETTAVVGAVTKKAAEQTGLAEGTKVINGGGDQIIQGIGNGATRIGAATVNIGSSGQIGLQSNKLIRNPKLNTNIFYGYKRDRWLVVGATMSAGLSLQWFKNVMGDADYNKINEEVGQLQPGSGGIIFLPYLNGERTPHVNPDLSGVFMGVSVETTKYHMARSVMEGVAYSLRQSIEIFSNLGLRITELIASGGGARSAAWLQLQADVYNIPLKVSVIEEQAALGAAIVAGVGTGTYNSVEEGCQRVVRYKDRIYTPIKDNHGIYNEYYQLFLEAYQNSKKTIESLTLLGRQR